jgi:hypothetical protein
VAGQSVPLGLKATDDEAWVEFMGQRYQLPADVAQQIASGTNLTKADTDAIVRAVIGAGIDPTSWLDLSVAGYDMIAGTPAYHLAGTVDVDKFMADVMRLAQDPGVQALIGKLDLGAMGMHPMGTGIMGDAGAMGDAGMGRGMPSIQDLQQVRSTLGEVLKTLRVDVRVTRDTYQLRQFQVSGSVIPPAGQDMGGVYSISFKAAASLTPATAPLTVSPPADVKPFSDLQRTLEGLAALFSGMAGQ